MLDTAEDQTLTDSFRGIVGLRSTSHSTASTATRTMLPRRLMQFVKISVVIIAITVILLIITAVTKRNEIFSFHTGTNTPDDTLRDGVRIGDMVYDQFTRSMAFKQRDGAPYLTFDFRSKHNLMSAKLKPYTDCIQNAKDGRKDVLCLEFDNINSAVYSEKVDGMDCHIVHWGWRDNEEMKLKGVTTSVEQCISMQENWYGGGVLSEQRWPLNRVGVPMQPYITRQFNPNSSTTVHFESFLEPYFVNSKGTAIVLDPFLPLFVSINDGNDRKLCFKSAFEKPYQFKKPAKANTLLKFTVCKDRLARFVHWRLLKSQLLNRPLSSPNVDILQKPVWSTRGLGVNINEPMILTYINSVKSNNLNFSQLFIDGNYSRSQGSVYFDEKKFPHSAQLAMELESHRPHENLKLATEVYPLLPNFMSSQNFTYSNSMISQSNKDVNEGLLLDVSNKKAADWFITQLKTIVNQVKVKGFRFSGGEAETVLDRTGMLIANYSSETSLHPNQFTHEYNKIAGQFQENSFLGSGYKSQSLGLVADAGPFLASWIHRKGLKSIIPTVITCGIMGYPFVSAGPIGGINYHLDSSSGHFTLSDRNLYLRWLQLATFLPVMEFSVGPWQYDAAVVNITRNLIAYRQNEVWPKYLSPAIQETMKYGLPVIRPLWWVAPLDKTAQYIDCEFLVGDNLLIAPVLEPAHTARQVYLPFGFSWRDMLRGGKIHKGGQWLRDYEVAKFEIAHFERVGTPSL